MCINSATVSAKTCIHGNGQGRGVITHMYTRRRTRILLVPIDLEFGYPRTAGQDVSLELQSRREGREGGREGE